MTLDEEYARTVLATHLAAHEHPVAQLLSANEINRSLQNSPAFCKRMARSMKLVEVRTSAGIILPNMPAMSVELPRVHRVIKKITRGLFYEFRGRPLPRDCTVSVDGPLVLSKFEHLNRMFDQTACHMKWWNLGEERAFIFRGAMETEESNESAWLIAFYLAVPFLVITSDNDSALNTVTTGKLLVK